MNVIYVDNNYLIIEFDGGRSLQYALTDAIYHEEDGTRFVVKSSGSTLFINFADSTDWEDDGQVAYTTTTLRTLFRANTGA